MSAAAPLTAAITIPAGTAFSTAAGTTYTSTAAVTWAQGSSLVRVPVQADVAGLVGNASAALITTCALFPISSGYTVGNALIANGADAETDAEREARFAAYIRGISGGTIAACLYAAGQAVVLDADGNITESVARIGYTEIPGRFTTYIYSNQGVPSAALLTAGQLLIDGSRDDIDGVITPGAGSAGVRNDVLAMAERAVTLSIKVSMLDGYTLTTAVRQSLTDIYDAAIRSIGAGQTMYLGTMVELLLAAPGVAQVVPQTTANITSSASEALVPGALTIAAL